MAQVVAQLLKDLHVTEVQDGNAGKLVWLPSPNKGFQIKSYYHVLRVYDIQVFWCFLGNARVNLRFNCVLEGTVQSHYWSCGILSLWRERNARCFEGHKLSEVKLKYLLLKTLFDWTLQSIAFLVMGFLDFIDSLRSNQFCRFFYFLFLFSCSVVGHYASRVLGQNLSLF